jgi:hypothetical protein
MEKDDIIYVYYWKRVPVSGDIVMRETSKMLSDYLNNYQIVGHLGQEQPGPHTAYAQFQSKARNLMESHGVRTGIPIQVGQDESKQHIKKLQTGPEFIRWEDPITIDYLLGF